MARSDFASDLVAHLRGHRIDPRRVRDGFDAASRDERLRAARALGRLEQRALYRAVDGAFPLRLVDLVPSGVADLGEVRHPGRNSLPLFSRFEKRFCRPRGTRRDAPGELYGYNFHPLAFLAGPGYFVAAEDPTRPEVRIDYARRPAERPPGWPPLCSNRHGLARLVFGSLVDTLRRVSEHVSIGSAARGGKELGSWFILVRED